MTQPQKIIRLLPVAVDDMQAAVASGDLDAMGAADRTLHHLLAAIDPAADLQQELLAPLRRAEQALQAARVLMDQEMQRLAGEMDALQHRRTGAQAYADHDLPLDEGQ